MGEKGAKVLQFRTNQLIAQPLKRPKTPTSQLSTIARVYHDARLDLGSKEITASETQEGCNLFDRLSKIEEKAENLNIKTLSRCHSGGYTTDQATVELMRLGLITHISTLLRKILKNSLLSDPATFRCTVIVIKDFLDLVKNREFMPERSSYSFSSDLEANKKRIEGVHFNFRERLEAFAASHCEDFSSMSTIELNAKNLIDMFNQRNS